MGWAHAVYVAQAVTGLLCDVGVPGTLILSYIDNVYVFGHSEDAINEATRLFVSRCSTVSASFTVTTPTCSKLVILGVECDLVGKTFSLPTSFLDKFRVVLSVLDQGGLSSCSTLLWWKVFGNLVWACRVLALPLYDYSGFMSWLSRRAAQLAVDPNLWTRPCHIWPSAFTDLRRLIGRVLSNLPRTLMSTHGSGPEHTFYSDASDVGLGIVHCGRFCDSYSLPIGSLKGRIIAERELSALVIGVEQTKREVPDVANIIAHQDNTTVIAWVRKKKGKSYFSNQLLRRLFTALGESTLDLRYVASAHNLADAPSRQQL